MEIGVVDMMEIGVVDVMEIGVVDVTEIGVVDVMEIGVVDVMEVAEDAMRGAIGIQKVDLAEKISVIETVRQEMNKKSPMGRGTDLVDVRETGAEIGTARIKQAKDAMEGKVPASIARIVEIPNPTKTLPPLARRPMHPLKRSREALVSFWLVSSGANKSTKDQSERRVI
uniref:Uncharacterized protein n=1 Tax=uncultured Verrucomicrobiales bacterium HF0130_14P10 TaxID=723606 RepID=E7C2M6_9BACT|nr:hypothetical protein [uncultured Verrucomicrobiales bacterium HF0130_14P10]